MFCHEKHSFIALINLVSPSYEDPTIFMLYFTASALIRRHLNDTSAEANRLSVPKIARQSDVQFAFIT